jgi:hypothetical protein
LNTPTNLAEELKRLEDADETVSIERAIDLIAAHSRKTGCSPQEAMNEFWDRIFKLLSESDREATGATGICEVARQRQQLVYSPTVAVCTVIFSSTTF